MKSRFIWFGAGLCAAFVAACAVGDPAADTTAATPAPPRLTGAAAEVIIAHAQSDSRVLDSVSSLKQHGWADPDWLNAIVEIKSDLNVATIPVRRLSNGTLAQAHINFIEGDLSSEGVAITGDDEDSFAAVRADLESDVGTEPSPAALEAFAGADAHAAVTPDARVCAWACQAVGSAACTPFSSVVGAIICGTLSGVACNVVCGPRKAKVCHWSKRMVGHPCILFGKWVLIPSQGEVHTCNGFAC